MNKIICVLVLFCFSGCYHGFLYDSTTEPIVTNVRGIKISESGEKVRKSTLRGLQMAELSTEQFREPVTSLRISAEWKSRAIGDAVKRFGMNEVYYADLHRFSILGGLYKRDTIRVWGDKAVSEELAP